jgi:tetratricopeptide (TPR) repeat protein
VARAAAKRKQRAPAPPRQERGKRPEHDRVLEDQLFFSRLRRQAKWVFALLAVVFAGSFIFLGVGSGNAGLGDVFQNIFSGGGGGGASASDAREKLAANPRNVAAQRELAQALQNDGRTAEAIAAYERLATLQPKGLDSLNQLAALYEQQSRELAQRYQLAAYEAQQASSARTDFGPGGKLGEGLRATEDPLGNAVSTTAAQQSATALAAYQANRASALAVYRKIAALEPDEPSAYVQVAQAAQEAGDSAAAIAAWQTIIRRFPEDRLAQEARNQIKQLSGQTGAGGTG